MATKSESKAPAKATTALRELKATAKIINDAMKSARSHDLAAVDARLIAAKACAEAQSRCLAAKVAFGIWCKDNLEISPAEAGRLAKIGAAEDPAKALADFRAANAAKNKAHRAAKKAQEDGQGSRAKAAGAVRDSAITGGKPVAKVTPMEQLTDAIRRVPTDLRENAARTVSEAYGMVALPKAEVARLRKGDNFDARDYEAVRQVVMALCHGDQVRLLHALAMKLGATVANAPSIKANTDGDAFDIPDFLKRETAKATGAPKARTAKPAPKRKSAARRAAANA